MRRLDGACAVRDPAPTASARRRTETRFMTLLLSGETDDGMGRILALDGQLSTLPPWLAAEPRVGYAPHGHDPVPQPHRPRSSADPAQAFVAARSPHQHEGFQAAGERDRDADGVRSDEGPAARAGGHRDAPREDEGRTGLGEKAGPRADPAGGTRYGRGHHSANSLGARRAHRHL